MAIGVTKAHTRIVKNQQWEDYQSLKRFWSSKTNNICEVIYDGVQTASNAAVEFISGHGETIAFNAADTQVYLATEADDANQKGKTVWIDYAEDDGTLHEGVATILDTDTSSDTEVPVGCLGTPYVEALSARGGTNVTMTAVAGTIANQYAGWYVVACGDATHQEGNSLLVVSSNVATPVVLEVSTVPDADWADDNVSLQKTLHQDVYRIRRIYCELETLDTKEIMVVDKDNTNSYAVIGQANTQGSAGSRYSALSSAYRCFLGRLQISAPYRLGTDADPIAHQVGVTFTPKSETGQTAADITLTFDFLDKLDWQPCIELEPKTDAIITIKSILNDATWSEVLIDFTCLEVTV